MKQHISLDLSPNESYMILDLINDRIHFWEDKQNEIVARKGRCPSSIEYDELFVECRIRELRSLRTVYLAAVRQSRIQT
jgi:hypothetical protein